MKPAPIVGGVLPHEFLKLAVNGVDGLHRIALVRQSARFGRSVNFLGQPKRLDEHAVAVFAVVDQRRSVFNVPIESFEHPGARRLRPAADGEKEPRAVRRRRDADFVLGKAPVMLSVPFGFLVARRYAEIRLVKVDSPGKNHAFLAAVQDGEDLRNPVFAG